MFCKGLFAVMMASTRSSCIDTLSFSCPYVCSMFVPKRIYDQTSMHLFRLASVQIHTTLKTYRNLSLLTRGTNPGALCSETIKGSMFNSVFHISMVNKMSTRNIWETGGQMWPVFFIVLSQPWRRWVTFTKQNHKIFFKSIRAPI